MSPREGCCYTCAGCDRPVCGDRDPSPGEVDQICAECWMTEDSEAVA